MLGGSIPFIEMFVVPSDRLAIVFRTIMVEKEAKWEPPFISNFGVTPYGRVSGKTFVARVIFLVRAVMLLVYFNVFSPILHPVIYEGVFGIRLDGTDPVPARLRAKRVLVLNPLLLESADKIRNLIIIIGYVAHFELKH